VRAQDQKELDEQKTGLTVELAMMLWKCEGLNESMLSHFYKFAKVSEDVRA